MKYSEALKRMLNASEHDKQRQRIALDTCLAEMDSRARKEAPTNRVILNTNLSRAEIARCDWHQTDFNGIDRDVLRSIKSWSPAEPWGLLLHGQVGSGKTHLLKGLMIHWARKQKTTGLFFAVHELMNNFRSHLDYIEDYKRKLIDCDILVLDDFGSEKTTEFVQTELLSFIDKRINLGKSLFVTSNHSPERLKCIYDMRILDRLQALMQFVKCDGPSYREKIYKSHHQNFYEAIQDGK